MKRTRRTDGICPKCGVNPRTNNRAYCSKCHHSYRKPEAKARHQLAYRLKSSYGITVAERNALIMAQNFKCAACKTRLLADKPLQTAIDHCHDTGKVRAILCFHCNLALGAAKEDPIRLRALASYIERYPKKAK